MALGKQPNMAFSNQPISDGRADWRAREVCDGSGWTQALSPRDLQTLAAALAQARAAGIDIDELTCDNFPLPGLEPLFARVLDELETGRYYIHTHITSAQRYAEVPRLSAEQIAAMDAIDALAAADEFHFSTMFEPGDLQFLNNHVILHSRTAFEDHDEPERRGHLLRIWLSVHNSRPLNQSMGTLFRDQSAGAIRGGYPARGARRFYETSASMT